MVADDYEDDVEKNSFNIYRGVHPKKLTTKSDPEKTCRYRSGSCRERGRMQHKAGACHNTTGLFAARQPDSV